MALALGFTSPPLEVEPFDGMRKFRLWQILVKVILEDQGLLETLSGKSNKPDDMSDEDWKTLRLKAIWIIISSLAPSVQSTVTNEKSPEALWKKLESDYALNFRRNRLFHKKKLYQLKMEQGSNIQDHINQFSRLIGNVEIEEEDKLGALLTSLPPSYENLVTNILSGEKPVKLEDVIALLLGDPGHECSRKMKGDTIDEEGDENSLSNVWILGTAAPFHVCSHRDWFDTYESFEGYIYAHHGDKMEIVGIGDVKVTMYNGSVMTLCGVRHVPTYVTNMISVMKLSHSGYKCVFGGGATFIKKNGIVVMEGETMLNGLPKLKGCASESKYLGKLRPESTKYMN